MDFTGRYSVPAPPEIVWNALNDPEILKSCIPGCEALEKVSDTDFRAAATLKIGPMKASFRARIALSDLDPPRRCKIAGEGQGGVAGFAKGHAEVDLTPEGASTLLSYRAHASVGGKLAQIGQRLIDSAAKQIADDFFARFTAALAPKAEPTPDPEVDAAILAAAAMPVDQAKERDRRTPEIWIVSVIGVVAILLALLAWVL